MKNKLRKSLVLIFVLIISLQLLLNFDQNFAIKAFQKETEQDKSIIPTVVAPDFNITDITSGISYNLSDFLGKPILLQLANIFISDCPRIMPDLYRYYTEDMFQLISIEDFDDTEPKALQEQLLRASREQYGFHWIVGFDYDGTIWDKYAYGDWDKPQFILINPSGEVTWHYYGYVEKIWPEILEKFQIFLPDDTTDPQINEFTADKFNTEFSIYAPAIDVYANLTDDRYVRDASLIANIGAESYLFELELSEVNDIFEVDETVTLLPSELYGETQIDFVLEVEDIWNNTIQSSVISLDVTDYADMESPTIGDVGIDIVEVDENTFTSNVYAAISDDLMVLEAQIQLIDANDDVIRTNDFAPYNATYMKATFANLLYVDGQPYNYTIKIIVTDVAGKTSDLTLPLAEVPTTTNGTNATLMVSLVVLLTFGCLAFRKKRR